MSFVKALWTNFNPLSAKSKCKHLSEDGLCLNEACHRRTAKVINSKGYCSYRQVCRYFEEGGPADGKS